MTLCGTPHLSQLLLSHGGRGGGVTDSYSPGTASPNPRLPPQGLTMVVGKGRTEVKAESAITGKTSNLIQVYPNLPETMACVLGEKEGEGVEDIWEMIQTQTSLSARR